MTIEHKIVVGLDDIKTVIFECKQCRTRVSMSPDEIRIPPKCPKENCVSRTWIVGSPSGLTSEYEGSTAAHINFVDAIGHIRKNKSAAFRILLEFDDALRNAYDVD
jgi:hypothetical protein